MKNSHDTLRAFYAAMARHDWSAMRALMHPDFTFRGPGMVVDGADQMIDTLRQARGGLSGLRQIEVVGEGDTLAVFVTLPLEEGTLRVAERVTLSGGKIRSSEVFYDTHAFAGQAVAA